jgi:hypothetical protein
VAVTWRCRFHRDQHGVAKRRREKTVMKVEGSKARHVTQGFRDHSPVCYDADASYSAWIVDDQRS